MPYLSIGVVPSVGVNEAGQGGRGTRPLQIHYSEGSANEHCDPTAPDGMGEVHLRYGAQLFLHHHYTVYVLHKYTNASFKNLCKGVCKGAEAAKLFPSTRRQTSFKGANAPSTHLKEILHGHVTG